MQILDLIFIYRKGWVLKERFQVWILIIKKNDFKERLTDMIFIDEKEWF